MTYLFIFFFIFSFLISISIVYWTLKNGIGPLPSSQKAKRALLDHLPQHWQGFIFELGSGWGTLAFPLAKKYPNCTIVAFENSPVPYFVLKLRHFFSRHKNLQLKRQDFFNVSFENATMIVSYLYPGAMQRLKKKFEEELNPGTLVASNTFSVPGWQEQQIIEIQDIYHSKIYIYYR